MTLWMLYAATVALLLGGAAHLTERALRATGRPARWSWAAAMASGWLIPLHALLGPGPGPSASPAGGAGGGEPLAGFDLAAALAAAAPARPLLDMADAVLPWAWAASALLAGALVLAGMVRLGRESRRWTRERVGDETVRLSPDFGPAVVGVLRPEIVLPRWILELGDDAVDLVLRHEGEHRSARDTLLLTAGAAAVLLAPWNLPMWWHLARLRQAVELDCDDRVLRTGVAPRRYGSLLVTVGEHAALRALPFPRGLPAVALTEHRPLLERRIRMIAGRDGGPGSSGSLGRRVLGVGGGVLAAGALVLAACEAPAPTAVEEPDEKVLREVAVPRTLELTGSVGARLGGMDLSRLKERAAGTVEQREPPAAVRGFRFKEVGQPGQPRIFVDGVEMKDGKTFRALDPDEIERVEVLKGAAAETLYGEESRHGVIRIYLKE